MSRKRILLGAAGAIVLGLPAVPALAQTEVPTGSMIRQPKPADYSDEPGLSSQDQGQRVMNEFGECIIQVFPRRVEALIALPPGIEAQSQVGKLATSECLRDGTLKFPPMLMIGAIFRALYRREYPQAQPPLGPNPLTFANPVTESAPAVEPQQVAVIFADCAVRADPAAARAFLLATPGKPAQREALAKFSPHLGPCMEAGARLTFSKATILALVAEALYREARAVAPAH